MSFRKSLAFTLLLACPLAPASAAPLTVIPGPSFDPSTHTGYHAGAVGNINTSGLAAGSADKHPAIQFGHRAVRWNSSGATILPDPGTSPTGYAASAALDINDFGHAVGVVRKFVDGQDKSQRAARWDASGNFTELPHLGLTNSGSTESQAYDINNAGIAVGYAHKFTAGSYRGSRPVRWDATGNLFELPLLTSTFQGHGTAIPAAINESNLVVGTSEHFVANAYRGSRAARWNAAGEAFELPTLGASADGTTFAGATDVNDSGTAIGFAEKYVAGLYQGKRAVRWDASGVILELPPLEISPTGQATATAHDLSNTGLVAGHAQRLINGVNYNRAVRWTTAGQLTELGSFPSNSPTDPGHSIAYVVNDAGITAGFAEKFLAGLPLGPRAVYWTPDGSLVDLNDLIPPTSAWTLLEVTALSNSGHFAGRALFDPDGPGPLSPYPRLYSLHVPSAAVIPEPAAILLLPMTTLLLRRSRPPQR